MSATIQHVRVYIDQAAVTWRIRVPATPDNPTVRFAELPTAFEHESLRAEAWAVQGDQRHPLDVVEVSSRSTAPTPDERRDRIQAELAAIEDRLAELEDEDTTDRFGLARLQRYATTATQKVSMEWLDNDPPLERWLQTFDSLRTQRQTWAERRQVRETLRQRLQIQKADKLGELEALGNADSEGRVVSIGLAGDLGADAWEVELTGLTHQAQWMPAYELRIADPAEHRATLTAVALVRQTTGQDWNDVEVIATTARPPLAEPPPPLRRLEVSGIPSDEDRTVISSHEEVARLTGVASSSATPATVEHTAKATIAAHGRAVRVELFTIELPLQTQLEVAPAQRTTAVQAAILDNTAGRVLLPGKVSVFRAKHYAGQSQIAFVAAGERFLVPVGTDGRIRVERRVIADAGRKSALTGATTYDFSHTTMVENLSPDEIEVIVRDRTPVSKSEAVTVKLLERPADLTVDDEDGLTEVRLTLAAHARRQLDVAYRITTSRGVSLNTPQDL